MNSSNPETARACSWQVATRTAALRETVRAWAGPGTQVLVTRQATITAVTGIVTIVGRIP